MQTIHVNRQEDTIPGGDTSFQVVNLGPKTRYQFNISAVFIDGSVGSKSSRTTQTRIERKFIRDISCTQVLFKLNPKIVVGGGYPGPGFEKSGTTISKIVSA